MAYDEMEALLNKTSILRAPTFTMPLGLIDMAAYIREKVKGVEIQILDIGKDLHYMGKGKPTSFEEFTEKELDKVGFTPDVIGISIGFSSAHNASRLIAKKAKQRWGKAIIICGGNHATNLYQYLLKDPYIDFVIRGEGEMPFTEFISNLKKGKRADILGLFDREKAEKGIVETAKLFEDLNLLPMPAYDLLDLETYRKTVGASIMFSRGCVFRCTFCASHTVHGRRVRFKSNEKILAEFRYLVDALGFNKIIIEDDLFAADKKKFFALAEEMKKYKGRVKYLLPQGLSMHILDEQIIDAITEIGIDEAAVAIESGSEYTQKHIIRKNIDLAKAKRILKYLRKKNFGVWVNFILGFPDETRELMQETIDYLKTLDVDWVFIFHALPLPGSEIYQTFVSRGIIKPESFNWDGLRLGRRTFDTPEISAKDLEKLVYDTNIEVNYFNHSNLRHKRYKRAIHVFNLIILSTHPFQIVARYCRGLAYLGLNDKKNAEQDFRDCIAWIKKNRESARLYQEYGDRMPLLKEYLGSGCKN